MTFVFDIETYDPLLKDFGPSCLKEQGEWLSCAWTPYGGSESGFESSICPGFSYAELAHWTGKVEFAGHNLVPTFKRTQQRAHFLRYLQGVLTSPVTKVAANASYELTWAYCTKMAGDPVWSESLHRASVDGCPTTKGLIYDIQVTEAVLRGTKANSVEAMAARYGLAQKPIERLVEAVCERLGAIETNTKAEEKVLRATVAAIRKNKGLPASSKNVKYNTAIQAWLWVLTRENDILGRTLLQEYNCHDVQVTEAIHHRQKSLSNWDAPIHIVEVAVTPVIALMMCRGVRYSHDNLQRLATKINTMLKTVKAELHKIAGCELDEGLTDKNREILGPLVGAPKTDTGKYALNKETFAASNSPVGELLSKQALLKKLADTFISSVLKASYNGRVYPRIFQIGREEGGTITGRLSYQGMNLQNQPKPKEVTAEDLAKEFYPELGVKQLASEIRQIFQADEGQYLLSADYASQEPRFQVEFAYRIGAPGAAELMQSYQDDPELSLHEYVKDLCNAALIEMGQPATFTKAMAKPINLGIPYGSGRDKVIKQIPGPAEIGGKVYDIYVERFPTLLWMLDYYSSQARANGFVTTMFGRVSAFTEWCVDIWKTARLFRWSKEEVRAKQKAKDPIVTAFGTLEDVQAKFPNCFYRLARPYSGLNRVVQGSSADQTKTAIFRAYYICNVVPLIQVHDELLFSVGTTDREFLEKLVDDSMNKAVNLIVPIVTEYTLYSCGWASDVIESGKVVTKSVKE